MRCSAATLRSTALLLVGTFGVHELRYALAYGPDAGDAMAHRGHGYLMYAMPMVGLFSALVMAQFLVRAATVVRGPVTTRRLRCVWPLASAALLGLYLSQELLAGLAAPGHPAGIDGALGNGGWIAAPLAVVIGGLLALVHRISRIVERHGLVRVRLRAPSVRHAASPLLTPRPVVVPRLAALATCRAGRGPPVVCG